MDFRDCLLYVHIIFKGVSQLCFSRIKVKFIILFLMQYIDVKSSYVLGMHDNAWKNLSKDDLRSIRGIAKPVEGLLIRTTKTSRCCKLDSLFHSVLSLDSENWTRQKPEPKRDYVEPWKVLHCPGKTSRLQEEKNICFLRSWAYRVSKEAEFCAYF